MIKGTRMIVITKNKIMKIILIIIFFVLFVVFFSAFSKNKSLTAFSEYKNIINSEIVPAKDMKDYEDEKKNYEQEILKHFFAIGENKKKEETFIDELEETKETEDSNVIKEPEIPAESVKINSGFKVSNATRYDINPQDFINKQLAFKLDDSGPQVLIMHTHTTESFAEETYIKGAPDRDVDETKNITAVGKTMAETFLENGIQVIHDKTVHDYPSYNAAYQSAASTINKNLNHYGSIKVVLDVHRDGITREDGTKVKLVTDINGEQTAQIMLVVGSDVNLEHKNWRENFKFASKIQAKAIECYPSLMRPIDLRKERFNEQLSSGSLIIEVGSNGNTLEEAIRGGKRIAEVISMVLKEG